jgi:hypothetical protein
MNPTSIALVAASFAAATLMACPQPSHAASNRDDERLACLDSVKALRSTLLQNPREHAAKSIAAGELRYLGVMGYGMTYPGIKDGMCVAQGNLGRVMVGTGDAACSYEHAQLQIQATSYAAAYNSSIVAERARRQLPTCR